MIVRYWDRHVPPLRHRVGASVWLSMSLMSLAILLWIVFVPMRRGYIFWDFYPHPSAAIALSVGALSIMLIGQHPLATGRWLRVVSVRSLLPMVLAGGGLLVLATATLALQRFANSGDEYAYLFQAETYLSGRLWNAAPAAGQAIGSSYTWVVGDKWVGQYPPGWPAMMALVGAPGIPPAFLTAALGMGTAAGLYLLVARRAGRMVGLLTAAAFIATPFTILTSASFHSHVAAAALVVAAVLCADRMMAGGAVRWAIATGAVIGLLGVTRSLTVAVVLLPAALTIVRAGRFRQAVGTAAGGLVFVAILLWYQNAITGDPMKPVYWLAGRTVDHLYFDAASIKLGLFGMGKRFMELSLWTSPYLPVAWAAALILKARRRGIEYHDLIFPLGVLVFVFYPLDPGNRYGPRYYYDFWPMLMFTIGSAIRIQPVRIRRFSKAMLVMSTAYGLITSAFVARDFSRIVTERRALYDAVRVRGIDHAVICVAASAGRLLPIGDYDLSRNGITADGPVVYARCALTTIDALAAVYPGRSIWTWTRASEKSPEHLRQVR